MLKLSLFAAAFALSIVASPVAAQSLSGDTIQTYNIYPTPGAVFVDRGTFTAPGGGTLLGTLTYTVTANQVIFSNLTQGTTFIWAAADFNGLEFVDESNDPGITGLLLEAASTGPITASDASYTSNSMSFNFEGQHWAPGQSATFDIQFGDAAVPEPGTWAMMLLGFGAIGLAMRRREVLRKTHQTA